MEGSAVVLTVHGYKQLMALEDFASWTAVQFAKLYTVSFVWTCAYRSHASTCWSIIVTWSVIGHFEMHCFLKPVQQTYQWCCAGIYTQAGTAPR